MLVAVLLGGREFKYPFVYQYIFGTLLLNFFLTKSLYFEKWPNFSSEIGFVFRWEGWIRATCDSAYSSQCIITFNTSEFIYSCSISVFNKFHNFFSKNKVDNRNMVCMQKEEFSHPAYATNAYVAIGPLAIC